MELDSSPFSGGIDARFLAAQKTRLAALPPQTVEDIRPPPAERLDVEENQGPGDFGVHASAASPEYILASR
jgi:hypothetical protein